MEFVLIIVVLVVIVWYLKCGDVGNKFKNRWDETLKRIRGVSDEKVDVDYLLICMPQRKEKILNTLKTFGINPTIIDAVIDSNTKKACHLSHLKALRYFLSTNKEYSIILEDDLKECDNFKLFNKRLRLLFNSLKNRMWNMIYLGKCWDRCQNLLHSDDSQLYYTQDALCRHSYLINRKGASIILKECGSFDGAGDKQYRKLSRQGKIKSLSVHPSLFYQNRNEIKSLLDKTHKHLKECCDF